MARIEAGDYEGALVSVDPAAGPIAPESLADFVARGGAPLSTSLRELGGSGGPIEVQLEARIRGPSGELLLVKTDQGWRIRSGTLLPGQARSPEEALDRFLHAIEARHCAGLVRLSPPDVQARHSLESLEAGCERRLDELGEAAKALRAARDRLLRVSESKAVCACRPGLKLVLEKKGDRWYVVDF
ncbi:MAG: hypothetical protein JXR96_00860 [Deltaproteobacteria bacterium]|nr:hypothetical protein [Deltaproteobacteria bacterium]